MGSANHPSNSGRQFGRAGSACLAATSFCGRFRFCAVGFCLDTRGKRPIASSSGGLALRLLREQRMAVSNVAVTLGSNKERQPGRLRELQAACNYIGFGLITTAPNGLEKINPRTRVEDPAHWGASVTIIQSILQN